MRIIRSVLMGLICLLAPGATAENSAGYSNIQLKKLEESIDDVIVQTRTPGVAVAIVQADGTVWQYFSGVQNKDTQQPVTEKTLFRVGSISKMVVAQVVLKLLEEGRLSLEDKVRDLAPEIVFENPWALSHPIRIHHLLEHTTGWDAPSFASQASNEKKPLSTKEALDLDPQSRTSRWVPGSRTAYNNTGPLVAAYIVEKLTGVRFEEYAATEFFAPLTMRDTGYFYDENFSQKGATNYRGNRKQPYRHMANRPSGGLNTSLADMVQYARFLLGRGAYEDTRLLSERSLELAERPYGSFSADRGMELSYGLGITSFHHNGYVYHGHEGSLRGTNSLIAYQRNLGVAHIVMSNGETRATTMIHRIIADLETAGRQAPPPEAANVPDEGQIALAGYYRLISPVRDNTAFLQSFIPWVLDVSENQATIAPVLGAPHRQLLASKGGAFRQNTTGLVAVVQGEDPTEGPVLYYGPQTLKKVSPVEALAPIATVVLWCIGAVTTFLFALIWIPRWVFGKIPGGPSVFLRLWPLLSTASLIAIAVIFLAINNSISPYAPLSGPTPMSLAILLLSLTFAATSFWSLFFAWRQRTVSMNRLAYWHSVWVAFLNAAMTLLLASYGLIGIRVWV